MSATTIGTGRCLVCPWTRTALLHADGYVVLACNHDGNARWNAPKMCQDCRAWCHTGRFVSHEALAAVGGSQYQNQNGERE